MRIVFVSSMETANWGGSEELWSQAAERLRQEGNAVSASVAWWPTLSERIGELEQQGIKVFLRTAGRGALVNRVWHKVKKRVGGNLRELHWVRDQKPDLVVISQCAIADGFEFLKFCEAQRLPYVIIVQCNADACWPSDEMSKELASVYRSARKVFCVSKGNLVLLQRQLAAKLPNASVVWNPYNLVPHEAIEWPKNDGVFRMASVARLNPIVKGQDLLLEVLAQEAWRQRPVELNLYGGGEYKEGLQRLVKFLGLKNVKFHGHVSDIIAVWRKNQMLVMPSRYEGLPLVLVDAMWCGRPTIVTDVGGNAELCLENETGFVSDAPTISSFGSAMERAWERRSDWQRMGHAGRTRVAKLLPKDPVADFCRQLNKIASIL